MFSLPSPSSDLTGMAASFPGSRDRDLFGGSGKEEGEGRKIRLGIFVVCNFSYVEIVNTLFIV